MLFFFFSLISSCMHTSFFKGESYRLPVTIPSWHAPVFYMRPNSVHSAGLGELAGCQQQQWQRVSVDRWLLAEPPACQWLATPLISMVYQGEQGEHCQLLCLILLVATCPRTTYGPQYLQRELDRRWLQVPHFDSGHVLFAGWQQLKCHTAKHLGALLRGHPTVSQKNSEDIRELKTLRLFSVLLNTIPSKAFGNKVANVSNENMTLEDYVFTSTSSCVMV